MIQARMTGSRRHFEGRIRRRAAAALIVASGASALASAGPASAVTVGQLAPAPTPACSFGVHFVQPTVTSGNPYVVPEGLNFITTWSTNATAGNGQGLTFEVFRRVVAGTDTFKVVGRSGPYLLTPSALNTFPANIAVQPGDVIGIHTAAASASNVACAWVVPGDSNRYFEGDLAEGASATFISNSNSRVNVTAEVIAVPTNARANALKKCKKKPAAKRKKCRKRANRLPV
jgi:hypothetical protein